MSTFRAPLFLVAGLAVLLGALPGRPSAPGVLRAPEEQPNPGAPSPVEVRFVNGSIVVMTLLQEKIEVLTEYGKLTVPHKDIRQIEFGIHTSEEEQRKIEDALRRLSSNAFKEREAAVEDLVALGPQAYLRLQKVATGDNPEAASRVESAVKKIREKFHPRVLRLREEDLVYTAKFTIVGRITTPTIKAKAEDFGELELRPAKLLSMCWLEGDAKKEVAVDAATYGSPGGRKWMDAGVRIGSQTGLKITATGQVDLWPQQPGQYMAGPDGQGGGPAGGLMVVNGRPIQLGGPRGGGGELLGRIGENGTPFVIGSRYTQIPKDTGKLYLQIVPSPWGGPSAGEYRVAISTGSFPEDHDREE